MLGPLYNRGSAFGDVFFIEIDMQAVNSTATIPPILVGSPDIHNPSAPRAFPSVKNNPIKDNPVSPVFFQFEPPPRLPGDRFRRIVATRGEGGGEERGRDARIKLISATGCTMIRAA